MDDDDLNSLDRTIAEIENRSRFDALRDEGGLPRAQYRPTRDPKEALRLMDKYISRVVKMSDGWAAVGSNGQASFGTTLPIAVCAAIVAAR